MLAAMPEQIVNSPNYRWLADQPCFADGDPALIVSASGILLFDSGNALLAGPGIAQIPELGGLKSGDSGGPAAQSASAKASANQGKRVPGRSLFDRHVRRAAKFGRLYG
jgi:hypothetical protein